MSAPGRPKREYRSAQHEGTPVSAQWVVGLRWAVLASASAAVVAHSCQELAREDAGFIDLGGGLVLTPDKKVVDVISMPDAISPETAAFLEESAPAFVWWPVGFHDPWLPRSRQKPLGDAPWNP